MTAEFRNSDQVTMVFEGEDDGRGRSRLADLEQRVAVELADERDSRVRESVTRALEQYRSATDEDERMAADDLIWRYLTSRSYTRPLREGGS
ncbi:MAG TPA: hypothetical protein VML55_17090 [Planctomycetaceae bacterium]|nr:hypothetical protein [Planctomycetaceae bacterium]